MLFKGPGSFKNNFKIGGNVDELKGYRLMPLTPPLFFHFTLPLNGRNFGYVGILKYLPLADIGQAGDSVPSVTLNITLALIAGLPGHQTVEWFEARTMKPKNAFPCTHCTAAE